MLMQFTPDQIQPNQAYLSKIEITFRRIIAASMLGNAVL